MLILAIETSGLIAGVAVTSDKDLIAESRFHINKVYSRILLPEIHHLLDTSGLKVDDIELIAVSIGPGSFTGLRLGLGTAKGMAHALNKPLVDVPTLDCLAMNLPSVNRPICAIMDAKRSEVYAAFYESASGDGIPKRTSREFVCSPSKLLEFMDEELNPAKGPIIFIGSGAFVYRDVFSRHLGRRVLVSPHSFNHVRAVNVALLACQRITEKPKYNALDASPRYIRSPENML